MIVPTKKLKENITYKNKENDNLINIGNNVSNLSDSWDSVMFHNDIKEESEITNIIVLPNTFSGLLNVLIQPINTTDNLGNLHHV